MHGVLQWIVSDDPHARALREKAVLHLMPVVDVDNVFKGFGGKEQ